MDLVKFYRYNKKVIRLIEMFNLLFKIVKGYLNNILNKRDGGDEQKLIKWIYNCDMSLFIIFIFDDGEK